MSGSASSESALEAIRRKEAEVKRRLAVQREVGEELLAEAERRAGEMVIAAVAEGRNAGEVQRQTARGAAEAEAQAIIARAQADAERWQQASQRSIAAAITHAVELVIGGVHET